MGKDIYGLNEVCRSLAWLERNLQEAVTVSQLAEAAGYSVFHFSRLFSQLTGHSPYDYLLRRRLTEAVLRLSQENASVTELAFSYQFGSLEAFSRSFKKMFGLSPARFKDGGVLASPGRSAFTKDYLCHINANSFFRPQMVNLAEMALAVNLRESPPSGDIALVFFEASRIAQPIRYLPCRIISHKQQAVGHHEAIKVIQRQDYACFWHCQGDLALTYQYILQTWLPLSGYSLADTYSWEFREAAMIFNSISDERKGETSIFLPLPK